MDILMMRQKLIGRINALMGESEIELLNSAEKLEKLLLLATPYLEKDDLGVSHTKRVLEIARKRLNIPVETEELAVASIILHDIGGRTIKDQYEKGPEIAAVLLKQLDYPKAFIGNVCEIIRTHHERLNNPPVAFKILYDADQLVRFSEEEFPYYESTGTNWNAVIERMYFSESKVWAMELLREKRKTKSASSNSVEKFIS